MTAGVRRATTLKATGTWRVSLISLAWQAVHVAAWSALWWQLRQLYGAVTLLEPFLALAP